MIILKVPCQNSPQMVLAEHDDVIQAFSPNRPNDPFHVRRLPWGSIRDDDLFDAHVFHALAEVVTVDAVSISNQESRRFFVWKCLDDLLSGPACGWVWRHIAMNDSPSVVPKDHEAVEQLETHSRDDKEVNRRDIPDMVLEEGSP